MGFTKKRVKDFYLLTTEVENIFINEYMPGAPGDFVKVYLYGLMYGQNEADMTNEIMSKQLRISEETLLEAWNYWESMGVVKKIENKKEGPFNFDIEFINLREFLYRNLSENREEGEENKSQGDNLSDNEVKVLISRVEEIIGKMLSPKEAMEIFDWKTKMGASQELILEAVSYCCEKQKTSIRYIEKVVTQWVSQGLQTKEAIEEYLDSVGQRQANYKRILRSLGMNRGATEAEKRMMDTWFNDMNYNIERVLEACDRTISTASPNLHYVNKVLENWYKEAEARGIDVNRKITVTQAVLNKYYDFLRAEAQKKAQERREQIYEKIPRIDEIDQSIRDLGSKLSKGLLTGLDQKHQKEIRRLINLLEEERAVLLTENNYSVDYTEIKYSCDKCSDTGFDEKGQRCACAKQRIGEAEIWQKTN